MLRARGATPDSVRGGLAGLRRRHGLLAADLVAGSAPNRFLIHVQRVDGDTPESPIGAEDNEQAVSLWEDVAGKVANEAMAGVQTGRRPGRGKELGQLRAVPVRLSEISLRRIRSMGGRWIDRAPDTTAAQRQAARTVFEASIDAAEAAREEMALARRLRAAATAIQNLYGGRDAFSLDVEHLDEVAQNRDIYPRSAIARRNARIATAVREGRQPGSVERQIAQSAANAREAREIARLYAEQQIDEELGTVVRSTGGHEDPVDLDLEIIETAVHVRVTARRSASRR